MTGRGPGGRRQPRPGAAAPRPGGPRPYAFLRTPRWLRVIAVGIVACLACSALGAWQWSRHTARVAAVDRVEANYDADPVPLGDVLGSAADGLRPAEAWQPVTATGRYVGDATVLLRNRPVAGEPAVHVLAPLVVTLPGVGPAVLVVDRGWLPAAAVDAGSAATLAAVPPGPVDVVVRLRPAEPPAGRPAPAGQAYAIAPAELLERAEVPGAVAALPALDAYGVLAQEDPAPTPAPRPLPRPETDLGTHLSYTFQWWLFAAGSLVAVAVLARREQAAISATLRTARGPGASDGAREVPGDRPPVGRVTGTGRRPGGRAEEEEDALIDAQLDPGGTDRAQAWAGPRVAPPRPRSGVSD